MHFPPTSIWPSGHFLVIKAPWRFPLLLMLKTSVGGGSRSSLLIALSWSRSEGTASGFMTLQATAVTISRKNNARINLADSMLTRLRMSQTNNELASMETVKDKYSPGFGRGDNLIYILRFNEPSFCWDYPFVNLDCIIILMRSYVVGTKEVTITN